MLDTPSSPDSPVSKADVNHNAERRKLWLAAIKPPMYSVAIMPIWIGSALARAEQGKGDGRIFAIFLLAAICILAWTNISNDVFDAQTGIDRNKRHSIVNLTGKPQLMFWLGNSFLLLGILGILWIAGQQKDGTVLLLILGCCALGYVYQGPPFRWGYQGWGEVLCFFPFGPLGVTAAYYSQTQMVSWTGLATSVVVGVTTSLILFCSHFHQVEDDQAAGKRSPVVRLGTARAARLTPWICGFTYLWTLGLIGFGILPLGAIAAILVSLLPAITLSQLLLQHHAEPEKIAHSKFIAIRFHFAYNLCLGLAVSLSSL
ncbi:MAG: 2-carboxy-1,4-naphthoquinone phytyltransferase [Cyanobacteria bacterium P01_G01_bin.54]